MQLNSEYVCISKRDHSVVYAQLTVVEIAYPVKLDCHMTVMTRHMARRTHGGMSPTSAKLGHSLLSAGFCWKSRAPSAIGYVCRGRHKPRHE